MKRKIDFDKYKIRMNIKSCCLFEKLTGKSFFKCETEDDALHAMYCSLLVNNECLKMSYDAFMIMLEDERVAQWISDSYLREMKYMYQFARAEGTENQEVKDKAEDKADLTMEKIAASLIINYGMDAHYVMYEMELWEIPMFSEVATEKYKADMAEKRLWTYLTIMPQIDHKKCKSPEKLIQFPWEKGDKQDKFEKRWEDDKAAVMNTVGKTFAQILAEAQEKQKKKAEDKEEQSNG